MSHLTMTTCIACCDEELDVVFSCPKQCGYHLCATCVRLALDDQSGDNVFCPLCKIKRKEVNIALQMVESLCGPGAIREVERSVRSKVELEVQREEERKAKGRAEMSEMRQRAQQLFNELSERLNMRCPRCSVVFFDYDGCNALTCRCGASLCAICLQDCGSDAHGHVREAHGDLFDKALFETARREREMDTVANFMQSIQDESFEVQELVRIECEKLHSDEETPSLRPERIGHAFLQSARDALLRAVRNDRLSLLSMSDEPAQGRRQERFESKHISPRNAIPEDYHLELHHRVGSIYTVVLRQHIDGIWKRIQLPEEPEDGKKKTENYETGPVVDALCNIRQQLRCSIVAFDGGLHLYQTKTVKNDSNDALGADEIAIVFHQVSRLGDIDNQPQSLHDIGCIGRSILGLNQNRRMMLLHEHVAGGTADTLLFPALCDYLGAASPKRLVTNIIELPADSIKELNTEQQSVAHPLSLKTAREVAGPPGTGKTKTITELVRSILQCTTYDVIVLSERNGAIDAIAEKIAQDCIRLSERGKKPSVKDLSLWSTLLAFGSSSLGPSTSLFTLNRKMEYHPEILEANDKLSDKRSKQAKQRKEMLSVLASAIQGLEDELPFKPELEKAKRSHLIAQMIKESGGTLTTCGTILSTLSAAADAWRQLASVPVPELLEHDVDKSLLDFSDVVGNLLPVRDDKAKAERPWKQIRQRVSEAAEMIARCLEAVMTNRLYTLPEIEKLMLDVRQAEEDRKLTVERVQAELLENARVFLCTIGSSHKLPTSSVDTEAFIAPMIAPDRPTVAIFDEAGCIPSFEFLGLTRLGRSIESIICVGDKHQLAPYESAADNRSPKPNRFSLAPKRADAAVRSLLDESALSVDTGDKVRLTKQYRVPRDIAAILNARVYKGNYETPPECEAPMQGFNFVDVKRRLRVREKKYVNEDEIDKCVELIRQSIRDRNDNIMVLTPYKKQQRELQYRFKREFGSPEAILTLTIDQCQGQEADIVILSLVQKPTRFLTVNRFNVALSRCRKKLYMVTDKEQFREAARNSKWDSHMLAHDLLNLSGGTDSGSDSDDLYF